MPNFMLIDEFHLAVSPPASLAPSDFDRMAKALAEPVVPAYLLKAARRGNPSPDRPTQAPHPQ